MVSTALFSRWSMTLDQLAAHLADHGWSEVAGPERSASRFFNAPDEEGSCEAWEVGEHVEVTARHVALPDEGLWVCEHDDEWDEVKRAA